jgi:hypothetical protein
MSRWTRSDHRLLYARRNEHSGWWFQEWDKMASYAARRDEALLWRETRTTGEGMAASRFCELYAELEGRHPGGGSSTRPGRSASWIRWADVEVDPEPGKPAGAGLRHARGQQLPSRRHRSQKSRLWHHTGGRWGTSAVPRIFVLDNLSRASTADCTSRDEPVAEDLMTPERGGDSGQVRKSRTGQGGKRRAQVERWVLAPLRDQP